MPTDHSNTHAAATTKWPQRDIRAIHASDNARKRLRWEFAAFKLPESRGKWAKNRTIKNVNNPLISIT
jgi:hypothetical protein